MKNIYFILCLSLIVSCADPNKSRSVFLWDYTTKSQLRSAGFVTLKHSDPFNKSAVLEDPDWLIGG